MTTPGPTAWAHVEETHTAAVFLAGDRAFKVKKPIRLPFLDFTDRVAREAACQREVALNRRLSPDVYLGVGHLVLDDRGSAEPVVVMRRLPDARRLDRLVPLRDTGVPQLLRDVARQLVGLHERGAAVTAVTGPGSWSAVSTRWAGECDEVDALGDRVAPAPVRASIRSLGVAFLAGRRSLFDQRVAAGLVRDGHGDLRCDAIYGLDDGPRITDCLEFDDDLRIGDVLLDAAFLSMDLERLGAADLASYFSDRYHELSAEHHPRSLEHFFVAYRALVRAKVDVLRASQTGSVGRPDELVGICERHLRRAQPVVVLVGGLPGSGKTTVSQTLAAELDLTYLSSDELRKDLAGAPHGSRTAVGWRTGPYTPELTSRTYLTLAARTAALLARGESVVLDASWSAGRHRDRIREVATECHALVAEVLCTVGEGLAGERLRRPRGGSSDADETVRTPMRESFDPWPEARLVPTDRGVASALSLTRTAVEQAIEPVAAGVGAR